ncbi:MAG: FAD-dependent oxidoreductase [Pseudomonadota bacterium]
MTKKILVIGAGFAGIWSALGAARLLDQAGKSAAVEIALISPEPLLHMRPRLHESEPGGMAYPLLPLLEAAGVRYIQGSVARIHKQDRYVVALDATGEPFTLEYDRLVLTSGSKMHRPQVPGLQHAFSIDQLDDAVKLDRHLAALAEQPETAARNTVVVVGGGFTGIELACELPGRLRKVLGQAAKLNVIVIEQADDIGPDLGPGPRPVISQALAELGVQSLTGSAVVALDADGVQTANGQRIEASTVIWTGGLRASALTKQVSTQRDGVGRVLVSRDLRVLDTSTIFAAGDVALAATDDIGNHALMSCQHALTMGRYAGHNVAADLLGLPLLDYKQPFYATCLDLGGWGAVYTEGWDRQVKMTGADAKELKRKINTMWIYPPQPERSAALAAADPEPPAAA